MIPAGAGQVTKACNQLVVAATIEAVAEALCLAERSGVDAAKVRIDLARRFMREEGLNVIGEIGDPDPYTAIMNAVQYFHISEIVISTLPEGSSQWVADKLVERVRGATNVPVEHIESRAKAEA